MDPRGMASTLRHDDTPGSFSVTRPASGASLATLVGRIGFVVFAAAMIGLSGPSASVAAERKPRAASPKSTEGPAEPDASASAAPAPASTGEKSAPTGERPAAAGAKAPAVGGRSAASSARRHLLREGFELTEQLGTFRVTGGRLVFSTDKGGIPLVALENLNLERIARVLADNPAATGWRITGTATEYRGVNYLLIERAVLRGSGDPTRP
jgi:hypothetical protein